MPVDSLLPLAFGSMEAAVESLMGRLTNSEFYAQNPEATPTHPYFGPLSREEWEVLHHKHFYHHLKQFGAVG